MGVKVFAKPGVWRAPACWSTAPALILYSYGGSSRAPRASGRNQPHPWVAHWRGESLSELESL
jgi:hypothetical protein